MRFLVLVFSLFSLHAMANECEISVAVGDNMVFAPASLTISKAQCSEVTITLTHGGKLPKNAMGHNWVLSTTADSQALAQAGWGAGLENNYLPPNDARTIAATKIIGGGETDTITLDTSELETGGDYTFFCSFVGHYFAMKGTFTVNA